MKPQFCATIGHKQVPIINPPMRSHVRGDPVPLERDEAKALVGWCKGDRIARQHVVAHVMNEQPQGTKRSRQLATAAGVLTAYPDYLVDAPCRGWHGLRVELKRRRGSTFETEQKAMQARLLNVRALSVVACGWEVAAAWIGWYLADGIEHDCRLTNLQLPAWLDAWRFTGESYWIAPAAGDGLVGDVLNLDPEIVTRGDS